MREVRFSQCIFNLNSGQQTEALLFAGSRQRPAKLIVFVHGNNKGTGAWSSVRMGHLLAADGFAAVLPSQPGYGESSGPRDFCGPKTVDAMSCVTRVFQERLNVSPTCTVFWGVSRGAIVGALQADLHPGLVGSYILQSGEYNIRQAIFDSRLDTNIRTTFAEEAGMSTEVICERTAAEHTKNIEDEITIVHVRDDRVTPLAQAHEYFERLRSAGKRVKMITWNRGGHRISVDDAYARIKQAMIL